MKKLILIALVLIPQITFAACTASDVAPFLAPNAPQEEIDAYIAYCNFQRNNAIGDFLGRRDSEGKLTRAILMTIFDENNNLREWIQAFKGQVALASSLADLKTRVAALPDTPDRTVQQAKTAVQNKINAGDAD